MVMTEMQAQRCIDAGYVKVEWKLFSPDAALPFEKVDPQPCIPRLILP